MAQITDLTWQQIETASTLSDLIQIDPTHGVMIKVSALLANPVTAKSASGVVETLFELLKIANSAQTTVNVGQTIGERLSAFPQLVSGTAINGYVQQSAQIVVRTPLATSGISGVSN
ncbi:hypothetical protein [Nostoc sp. PCC 7107]|uniref:hypothetical protein n=1 Tax=Nostoc sp. PCC 7107 TaxID=317936 RepID=UPI00029EF37F|nr:hypothetical protein [Nostoc sp. PCC 7107]AFY43754.1 hypothetical protein Nos7107_3164 [Nostoc sp. PCC 7107]